MNRKQKIIVSITGIFLVLMILVGLTYAYFLTKITGNTNTKSISVTTANLVLQYGENTNVVQGITNAEPGYSVKKIFTATNKGNSTVTYGAALENIVNELSRQQDLVYTLTCTSYLKEGFSLASDGTITGTEDGTCNGLTTEKQFPNTSTMSIMTTNTIDTTHTQAYKLTLTYKEMGVDQSEDMNKTFSAKVNIVDVNALTVNNPYKNDNGTLKKAIIENAMLGLNGTEYRETTLTTPGKEIAKEYDEIVEIEEKVPVSIYEKYNTDNGSTWQVSDNEDMSNSFTVTKYEEAVGKWIQSNAYFWKKKLKSYDSDKKILTFAVYQKNTEKSLNSTEDDYGTSYYYRGNVADNYLNFDERCWRIVRIQGDGSIKLILEDKNTTCESETFFGDYGAIRTNYGHVNVSDDSEMGYHIEANYVNSEEGGMANKFLNFQQDFTVSQKSKLKSGDWCLYNYSETTSFEIPSLKCEGNILEKFKDSTDMYVGTLTVNEMLYAGGKYQTASNNYLKNKYSDFTYDSCFYSLNVLESTSTNTIGFYNGIIGEDNYCNTTLYYSSSVYNIARPSIILNANVKLLGGDGTQNNPYVIE